MSDIAEGTELYAPSARRIASARLTAFAEWASEHHSAPVGTDYDALWSWSVEDPGRFWAAVWEWFEVVGEGDTSPALANATMPGAEWFPNTRINYAENALRLRGEATAVVARNERGEERRLSRDALYRLTAQVASGLRAAGVGVGDTVVGFVTNDVEALAAFLAAASLGATWSSCSPEFGVGSVLDRFGQIKPKVLFAVDAYDYGGKRYGRSDAVAEIIAGLDSLVATVLLPGSAPLEGATAWEEFLGDDEELTFARVPFDHPLWVLYSSGTTGLPKAIVQGHGGIVLEHLKALSFHCDLHDGSTFFWFTTTGWMMWNFLVSGLLVGSTVVLYDGSPGHPDLGALWRMAEETGTDFFGASAPYLLALEKDGYSPKAHHDVSKITAVGSTGAPLPAGGFAWVYDHVNAELNLGSVSGGSDVCTAFVLGCPWLPVHAGEIQCAGLGCDVRAYTEAGDPVEGEVGELVLQKPIPSMPVFFWGDRDGSRLRESYFGTFDGVWRHGDWVKRTERGTYVIYGRSDSTLNRGGVRMGTSEFYRVVESLPEIRDSLVVDTSSLDTEGTMWLFVVLADGVELDDGLRKKVASTIRGELSPRHVPNELRTIEVVPRTLNGKKMEVPIKKVLNGVPLARAVNMDTVSDSSSLEPFIALSKELTA
ncbi:MAG: acetoacetate--CoA ligase [Myxococcota bacterium]